MPPISRRMFLAASAAAVVAACSDSSEADPSTTGQPATSEPAMTSGPPPTGPPTTATAVTTATTVTTTTSEPATTTTETPLASNPFTVGVASGDPDETSVVLWTRLAIDPLNGGGMPADDIAVGWEMATDDAFSDIAASGSTFARAEHAHSVHVTAEPTTGSGPFFYRFTAGGYTSPIGRTLLAPAGAVGSATFVSASCQDYQDGFYAAHRDIAEQSPDFVVWLGDYIYESAGDPAPREGQARTHASPEPMDLTDYRNRYGLYKSDAHLQAAHAACPWFVIWDDHEVENNYAGLTPQNIADAGGFEARRRAAYQAWWEHQPVRLDPPPATGEYRMYRDVRWGDLLAMSLLDTRQYRSDQACGDAVLDLDPACPETFADERTLTGTEQEQWLLDTVGTYGTTWNVIGQQVVMANIMFNGAVLNYDQWDGYPADRQRILQGLADRAVPNVVVLSGDIHIAGIAVLRLGEPGLGQAVAVEFVDTSISSSAPIPANATDVFTGFADIVDAELVHRGYTLHTVTPAAWTAVYRTVDDVLDEASAVSTYRAYTVDAGTPAVRIEGG